MLMPGRHYNANKYRYGFNGKEHDPEWKGSAGSIYDYGFRIYDPRVAKFLSVDPLTKSFPFYSPYHYAGNSPIKFIDLDGKEISLPEITSKENINQLLDNLGVENELIRNEILAHGGALNVFEQTITSIPQLVDMVISGEVEKLLPPIGNTLCITDDCNAEKYKAWEERVKALGSDILGKYGKLISDAAQGDSYALGQIAAEIALLLIEGDESRFVTKLDDFKYLDDSADIIKLTDSEAAKIIGGAKNSLRQAIKKAELP